MAIDFYGNSKEKDLSITVIKVQTVQVYLT
jgi:hypothetical protein